MSIRSEREKSKMQEKYQMILAQMLKEDDNRFCADCDTKSPRWASWNLGIFICIRCAGFHRNLGVHISKVKSVNLDSWTAEQIASMQAMGNNRARAVYEANLPAGFRRPQADSALESFIRAKYEQRKWIAKEWIPPEITVSSDLIESESNPRRVDPTPDMAQVEKLPSNSIPKLKSIAPPVSTSNPVRQAVTNDRPTPIILPPSTTSISNPPPSVVIENPPDLLGLDEPSVVVSHLLPPTTKVSSLDNDPLHELFASPSTTVKENSGTSTNLNVDLESAFSSSNDNTSSTNVLTNDKILALYNSPQASTATGLNLRPATMQTPNLNPTAFAHPQLQPQHPHLQAHQKSASFGGNLYQQGANQYGPQPGFPLQQGYAFPPRPGMTPVHHNHPTNNSTPTLQNPPSAFTQNQLTDQFSQFVPFANSKTNTSASVLISGMPTRPVTEYMPASSDLLWQ